MKKQYKILLSISVIGALIYLMSRTLTIEIRREILNDKRTIGKMYINGQYFCDTLEDTYRELKNVADKVYSETAIPTGIYNMILSFSNKFQKSLPEILNVPFFTGIRVHTGTSEKDTAGCVLVGDYKNGVWSANGDYVKKLSNLLTLYPKATINIVNV